MSIKQKISKLPLGSLLVILWEIFLKKKKYCEGLGFAGKEIFVMLLIAKILFLVVNYIRLLVNTCDYC